jgi:hypothetical protein
VVAHVDVTAARRRSGLTDTEQRSSVISEGRPPRLRADVHDPDDAAVFHEGGQQAVPGGRGVGDPEAGRSQQQRQVERADVLRQGGHPVGVGLLRRRACLLGLPLGVLLEAGRQRGRDQGGDQCDGQTGGEPAGAPSRGRLLVGASPLGL